jgi:WD40 repeat protein
LQKFVRRNRLLVSSGASILVILLVAVAISSWQAFRATLAEREQGYLLAEAQRARKNESKEKSLAEAERATALRQAYNSDMNLARQALLANNYGRVVSLLNRHRREQFPDSHAAKADKDLRQWEWRYLWNQVRSDAAFALPRQSNSIVALAASPDGKLLASADRQGTVKLWDLFRRTEIATLRTGQGASGPPSMVRFAFDASGERLAIAFGEAPFRPGDPSFRSGNRPFRAGEPPFGRGDRSFRGGDRAFRTGDRGFGPGDRSFRTGLQVVSMSTRETVRSGAVSGWLQGMAFAPDGTSLLLYSQDQQIRRWDLASDSPPPTFQREFPHGFRGPGPMFARAVFSADARRLAVVDGGHVRLIDTASGVETTNIVAFDQGIGSIAFSPDGKLLAVGPLFTEVETSIKLFSTGSGQELGHFTNHVSWVPSLAFTPDGRRLISGGADQTVRVWTVTNLQEVATLRGHFSEVDCVAASADSRTILSGCKDGTLFGWDAEQREHNKWFESLPGQVTSVEFLPDNRTLLTLGHDGTVAVWDTATLQERERLTDLPHNPERMLVSLDGARLYTSSHSRIQAYDLNNHVLLTNVFNDARGEPMGVPLALIHNGQTLITAGGPGGNVRAWDIPSGHSQVLSETGMPPRIFESSLAVSPDERFAAYPGPERTVDLINLATGQKEGAFNIEIWGPSGMAFSRDGSLLAVAANEGISLCDVASRSILDSLRGHLLGVRDVAFAPAPDGRRLASCSIKADEAVKLWDLTSNHEVATLPGEGTMFSHLKFSPDGTLLVAINSQGKVHLWRAPSLDEIDRAEQADVSGLITKERH